MVGTFYTSHRQVNWRKVLPNEWIPRCHQLLLFYQMPSFDVRANIYYNVPVDHPPSQVTAI